MARWCSEYVIYFVCYFYIMMGYYSNGISSKTMASQNLGNQCKGLSPVIAGYDGAASSMQAGPFRSVIAIQDYVRCNRNYESGSA